MTPQGAHKGAFFMVLSSSGLGFNFGLGKL